MNKHFLNLNSFDAKTLNQIIAHGIELKQAHKQNIINKTLKHKTLAMIFDKASTRTRVSLESGMTQLGGYALFLSSDDIQLGREETIADTARVIGSMVDMAALRVSKQKDIEIFAQYTDIPVINALSDEAHPCQLLADMMTYQELRGSIQGKTVAWLGDGNNVCQSYMQAATLFDFHLNIATPKTHQPSAKFITENKANISLYEDAETACHQADLVVTDVWKSMLGKADEKIQAIEDKKQLLTTFIPYQVNQSMMNLAKPDALFTHCLPTHRDEEVSADIIDDPIKSMTWQAAENRLHAQKALLLYLSDC